MSKVIEIKKAPAVVKGAVLEFTKDELDYLTTALEVGFKAHKAPGGMTYVAPTARALWVTLDGARNGKTVSRSDYALTSPF